MIQPLVLILTLLATSWAAMIPGPSDSRFNKQLDHFMFKVDEKLEEIVQVNFPLISDAMLLNGTGFQQGFRSAMGTFKTGLVTRMKSDVLSLVQETKASRTTKGKLTFEEKTKLMDQLHAKWEASVDAELKSWSKETLTQWLHKAQDIWVGFETQVKDNLKKLKAFLERHNPFRKNVPQLPEPTKVDDNETTKVEPADEKLPKDLEWNEYGAPEVETDEEPFIREDESVTALEIKSSGLEKRQIGTFVGFVVFFVSIILSVAFLSPLFLIVGAVIWVFGILVDIVDADL